MIKYNLEELVKHRRGMLLIDNLLFYNDRGVVVDVKITKKTLFYNEGHVPVWIGVEYAAQAVAAWAGLQAKKNNEEPKLGLLLSCRKYKSTRAHFELGETLTIYTKEEFNDGQIGSYNCDILDAEQKKVVTVSIMVYGTNDIISDIKEQRV